MGKGIKVHRCEFLIQRGSYNCRYVFGAKIRCPCCGRWYCSFAKHLQAHWDSAKKFLTGDGVGLFNDLRSRGVFTGYEKYVVQLEPVLEAMASRGLPIPRKSYDDVMRQLVARREEIEKAMQALVPPECMPFHPPKGYKKIPKDITGMIERYFQHDPKDSSLAGAVLEKRWVRLKEWTPSPKNLLAYMRHKGHPIPTGWKTGRPTTDQLELTRLAKKTKDLLYNIVLEYREVSTVIDNHMKNWEPGPDGRVHPTFYYETGTGQLATRRPNVQNAPRHKAGTANIFRSMIRAGEGKILLEFDYKSFHAQTLAFEAEDRDYLRLAKLDIHSYLTAHFVREADRDRLLQLGDEDLAARLAEIAAKHNFVRDYKAKRAVLGYGFGMGYRKLYNLNQEAFDSQADAKRLIDTMNGLFPRAKAWRDEIRVKAHEQGYLMSRFGCIRWFWEVCKWVDGKLEPGGDDSESAVAFLPANDAFCHIKDAMLRLDQSGALVKYGLINQIHDSLLFECPLNLRDEAIDTVTREMERPSAVLINSVAPGGLSVAVGIKEGLTWNPEDMKKAKRGNT